MALHPELVTASLFSGIGGHELALRLAGFHPRALVYVERELFAVKILAEAMEQNLLAPAPVWDDVATFDSRSLRGKLDLLTASPPCQPYSLAGKRAGNDDKRAWDDGNGPVAHLVRIIGECRPTLVFLENVSRWVTGGDFDTVRTELQRLDYRCALPLFLAAEDIGATHKRERVWILAYDDSPLGWTGIARIQSLARLGRNRLADKGPELADTGDRLLPQQGRGTQGRDGAGSAGEKLGDSQRDGQPAYTPRRGIVGSTSQAPEMEKCGVQIGCPRGNELADSHRRRQRTDGQQREGRSDTQQPVSQLADNPGGRVQGNRPAGFSFGDPSLESLLSGCNSGSIPLYPPRPDDLVNWHRLLVEFGLTGLAPALPQSALCRTPDGDAVRVDSLRALGNGIVPLVAALAFRTLLTSLREDRSLT